MLRHLQAAYPLEACGFLSGQAGRVERLYCIDNVLQSPTAYEMDPHQQITAMIDMENRDESMLAIFHSHPQGPQIPSETDIRLAFYPKAVYLIISLENKQKPIIRAFHIQNHQVTEVAWQVV